MGQSCEGDGLDLFGIIVRLWVRAVGAGTVGFPVLWIGGRRGRPKMFHDLGEANDVECSVCVEDDGCAAFTPNIR